MVLDSVIRALRRLQQRREGEEEADTDIVIGLFRERFFGIRRERKGRYVREVVDRHYLSHRELGRILGFGDKSGGAIRGAMKGKISDDKFDLLRATVAKQVQDPPKWPELSEFTSLALVDTIEQLARKGQTNGTLRSFSREEFETLEGFLGREWSEVSGIDGDPGLNDSWVKVLNKAHEVAGTELVKKLDDVLHVVDVWGLWYERCKRAIPGQER